MRLLTGLVLGVMPLAAWAADGVHDMAGMNMPGMAMSNDSSPTVQATLTAGEVVVGQPVSLTLMLRDKHNQPLRAMDIDKTHTELMHLFLVDGSLTDYVHLHPVPGAKDGEWVAGFTPQQKAYKAWVEVEPKGDADQFVPLQLGTVIPKPNVLGSEQVLTAEAGGLRFTLTLAMPPAAGQGTLAILNAYDSEGVPVTGLMPIMGAYAHLVGFDKNLETIMHVHPSGAEPDSADSRGGPVLNFQLMPKTYGMHRLFLQVIYAGHLITVPFTINVN